jgi:hypothetical protein
VSQAPSGHEYLVVPAPRRAPKIKGVRDTAERFAVAVAQVMNEAGRDGWEYLRTDSLPMEARTGWLGGRSVTTQELLVFRRPLEDREAEIAPAPTFARPEPRGGGAVTPLSLRPAAQRPPKEPAGPFRSEPPAPDPEGPTPPRLGGAARLGPTPRKG